MAAPPVPGPADEHAPVGVTGFEGAELSGDTLAIVDQQGKTRMSLDPQTLVPRS